MLPSVGVVGVVVTNLTIRVLRCACSSMSYVGSVEECCADLRGSDAVVVALRRLLGRGQRVNDTVTLHGWRVPRDLVHLIAGRARLHVLVHTSSL